MASEKEDALSKIMRNFNRSLILFILGIVIPSGALAAQPIQPVFTSTSLDGQLIGLETNNLEIGMWQPKLAIAFPLDLAKIPEHIRYQLGLGIKTGYELPVVKEEVGNIGFLVTNWPSTPVLGREGQTGVELNANMGLTDYRAFIGDLWPVGEDDHFTPVAFFSNRSSKSFSLPYDIRFSISSSGINGIVLPGTTEGVPGSITNFLDIMAQEEEFSDTFKSTTYSASLSVNGMRLSGRYGTLENHAKLNRFEFVTGVRGVSQTLRGHKFWSFNVERNFNMYQTAIPIHLPAQFADYPFIPTELPVSLDSKLFFQVASATHVIEEVEADENLEEGEMPAPVPQPAHVFTSDELETEILFSWGMSTTLTVYEFQVRAQIIFTQQGETKFSFTF